MALPLEFGGYVDQEIHQIKTWAIARLEYSLALIKKEEDQELLESELDTLSRVVEITKDKIFAYVYRGG